MSPNICAAGEIGPFPVWTAEDSVSSFNPLTNAYGTKDVCLKAQRKEGKLVTDHLILGGPKLSGPRLNNPWGRSNPKDTDPRFDLFFTAYTIESFISFISGLSVFETGIENVLAKKLLPVEISTVDYPNAGFSPYDPSLIFGRILNRCGFGASGDVNIHEFVHYLTFSNNREIGLLLEDIEGPAIHEGLSDAMPTIFFDDPEVGEGVAACLGVTLQESPKIGIRHVNIAQLSLFYPNEGHSRSEMYAPFLWYSFDSLSELFSPGVDGRAKAREAMLVIIANTSKYLPAQPKKVEFVKAFYNAFVEFMKRPDFGTKYNFKIAAFLDAVKKEAKLRTLIEVPGDETEAFTLYPSTGSKEAVIAKNSDDRVTFKPEYMNPSQIFYKQYVDEIPVDGAGIRFVNGWLGVQVVPMIDKRDFNSNTLVSEEAAWGAFKSQMGMHDVKDTLEKQVRHGGVKENEKKLILDYIAKLKTAPHSDKVFLAGKTNLQYKFNITGVATFYIDSVDGSISISRQRLF